MPSYLQIHELTPLWLEHAPDPVAVEVVPSLQLAPTRLWPIGQSFEPVLVGDGVGVLLLLHEKARHKHKI